MGARRGTNKDSALIKHQLGLAGDTDIRDFSQDRGGNGGVAGVLDGGADGAGTLNL